MKKDFDTKHLIKKPDEARRRVPTASSGVSLIRRSIPKLDPQRNQRLYTGVGAPTALAVDRVAGSLTQFEDNEHVHRKNIEIISVSIRPQQVEQMNKIMQITGMKSRSKLISHAVSKFCDDQKEISDITNDNTVVFMISHNHLHKSDATTTILGYEDLVRTILHHHSKSGCLDILIVQGEPERIKQLYKKICIMKGISSIDFSII